jgi:hypothetical protein
LNTNTFFPTPSTISTTPNGYAIGAYSLNFAAGQGLHYTLPAAAIGTGAFTIEFWYNPTDTPPGARICGNYNGTFTLNSASKRWLIGANSVGTIQFATTDTTGIVTGSSASSSGSAGSAPVYSNWIGPQITTPKGVWHHYAFVRTVSPASSSTNNVLTVYVDGVPSTPTAILPIDMSMSADLTVGYGGGTADSIQGLIAGFRITAAAKYTSTFTPPTS